MIVRLSLLDRKESLQYTIYSDVYIGTSNGYKQVGTSRLFKNDKGNFVAELSLTEAVDLDYFFYYRGATDNDGVFIFSGIDFFENQQKNTSPTRLREMIIEG
ncbi:hypothetical protein SAMN05444008_102381 [Cnuella takakiae]|uniref:Uncharacterized protein n=1 Tax=Cnuella takakiae TaxID=1302690 RepID=A0A1M4VU44_9BACT|nr:hypothetical protein [Cnuella takakiae]OLY92499.1 hypothetical protein BUE76_11825 [Cnuella takakiae]SHE72400.1 hypothetical protein SAMN05444008_102381 [Cnuella takakiae]